MDRTVPKGAALLLVFVYETETKKKVPACYDVIFGHRQNALPKPLTSMTLGEVQAAQRTWRTKAWAAKFNSTTASSAAGAAQFMEKTLADLIVELRLRLTQLFDGDLQDRLGYHLLKRRGYEEFMAGKMSRTEFGKRLSQEWASFPVLADTQGQKRRVTRGQSYYAGDGVNKALVSPQMVEAVLDRVRQLGNDVVPEETVAPVIVETPVVADPGELEKSPAKSKTVLTWALTALGTGVTAAGSFLGGLDWRVQLFISAAIVGFAVYGIKRRFDLAKAVRDLNAEFGT
jgi:muramidase (phage lysozyme)